MPPLNLQFRGFLDTKHMTIFNLDNILPIKYIIFLGMALAKKYNHPTEIRYSYPLDKIGELEKNDLLSIRGCSKKSVKKINEILKKNYNISLRMRKK